MKFNIDADEYKGMWLVTLAGNVDLHTGNTFKKSVREGIDNNYKQVVVDFSQATYIDSTALGILVGISKRLKPYGGSLYVIVNTPNIRKMFEITALDLIFDVVNSLDEVVALMGIDDKDADESS